MLMAKLPECLDALPFYEEEAKDRMIDPTQKFVEGQTGEAVKKASVLFWRRWCYY